MRLFGVDVALDEIRGAGGAEGRVEAGRVRNEGDSPEIEVGTLDAMAILRDRQLLEVEQLLALLQVVDDGSGREPGLRVAVAGDERGRRGVSAVGRHSGAGRNAVDAEAVQDGELAVEDLRRRMADEAGRRNRQTQPGAVAVVDAGTLEWRDAPKGAGFRERNHCDRPEVAVELRGTEQQ